MKTKMVKLFKCWRRVNTAPKQLIEMEVSELEKLNFAVILDELVSEIESKATSSYEIACDLYVWSRRLYDYKTTLEPYARVSMLT